MQRRSSRDALHQTAIARKIVSLVREIRCHPVDERLAPVGEVETLPLQTDHVVTVCVQAGKFQFVVYFQVAHHLVQYLSFVRTADEVHPGLELYVVAPETLQATSGQCILLQNGDPVAVLGEHHTG